MTDAGYEVVLIGREKRSSQELLKQRFGQKRLKCWFGSGVIFYLEYNIRLFFFLLVGSYDLLYAVDLDTLSSAGFASVLKRKKLIYDAHEYFVEVPELQGSKFKKWLWNLVAKIFIPISDLNITVNKELSQILSGKYNYDFQVIRSVPLLDINNDEDIESEEKIILYQGVLNEGRGLEEAIKWISKKKEDIKLHIVGEGDLSDRLRKLKLEVDRDNKVLFLGWKSPSELDEITKKAWLGLNLLDGTSLNYQFSLANKFFNYMHAGVPSLNMGFPVYSRYCRDLNVGVCISDLKEESIDKAIISLINDPIKYTQMVIATKKARDVNCWQKEEVKLISLIDKIVRG
jgi:glycosyltransferase involved in cell wall biosynthesis